MAAQDSQAVLDMDTQELSPERTQAKSSLNENQPSCLEAHSSLTDGGQLPDSLLVESSASRARAKIEFEKLMMRAAGDVDDERRRLLEEKKKREDKRQNVDVERRKVVDGEKEEAKTKKPKIFPLPVKATARSSYGKADLDWKSLEPQDVDRLEPLDVLSDRMFERLGDGVGRSSWKKIARALITHNPVAREPEQQGPHQGQSAMELPLARKPEPNVETEAEDHETETEPERPKLMMSLFERWPEDQETETDQLHKVDVGSDNATSSDNLNSTEEAQLATKVRTMKGAVPLKGPDV